MISAMTKNNFTPCPPSRHGRVEVAHTPAPRGGRDIFPRGNRIERFDKYAVVFLNDGYFTVIDAKFVSRVESFTWCTNHHARSSRLIYARAQFGGGKIRFLHRIILGAQPHRVVDHIDGNGLNNTLENLRQVTQKENCQNRHKTCARFHVSEGLPSWVGA